MMLLMIKHKCEQAQAIPKKKTLLKKVLTSFSAI